MTTSGLNLDRGVPAFAGFPTAELADIISSAVTIFGVPTQSEPPKRPGCVSGPLAIREASLEVMRCYFESPSRTVVNIKTGRKTRLREDIVGLDIGDLAIPEQLSKSALDTIAGLVKFIVNRGAIPVLLGGDSRTVEGMIRGFLKDRMKTGIIIFTKKLTLSPMQGMGEIALSSLLGRANQQDQCPMLCVGINGLQPKAAWLGLKNIGGSVVTADSIYDNGIKSAVDPIKAFANNYDRVIYCIDFEVLDSGFAAGTPSINVGGITPEQMAEILLETNVSNKVAGIAVTNVAPSLDKRGHTEYIAAETVVALLTDHLFNELSK